MYCRTNGLSMPRRHVPVDVAQVVARLVLAQVGEVDAFAAEQRPVVALEPAVEAPDDPPLEAAQDPLGGQRCCVVHVRPLAQRDVGYGDGAR